MLVIKTFTFTFFHLHCGGEEAPPPVHRTGVRGILRGEVRSNRRGYASRALSVQRVTVTPT
jgi:hypothetical protein